MTPKQIAIVSGVVIVIGCAIAAIGSAIWVDAVGITVGGIGFVGAIGAAFYAVGQSEDRARAREDAARHDGPERP
jgi:hypothetical protein